MDSSKKVSRLELKERLYKRRYVVPNAVTVGNLFCGFLSIIYASSDRFEKAIIAILVALLLDGLDGRVARRLNATSKFGVEFDSFSDLVSFGVAPAMLMYHWCFQQPADEFGVFICFVYALCAACRLARFNISEENLKGFEGLASPAAAAYVLSIVYLMPRVESGPLLVVLGTLVMISASYLMVCQIPYMSIKMLKFDKLGIAGMIALGTLIASIWYSPKVGFVLLALGYAASGPLALVLKNRKNKSVPPQAAASL